MYLAIMLIVLFAGFAMMVREGLWNNLLLSAAILIAGVVAFGVFQPITVLVDEQTGGSYTYLLDIVVLSFTFTILVGLLKALLQVLSRKRVRFKEPFDSAGGVLVGLITAYLLTGFTMAVLHTAPFSRDAFGGRYDMGDTREQVAKEMVQQSGVMRPDLVWLGLVESVLSPEKFGAAGFSSSLYVSSYAEHRGAFEKTKEWLVKRN